MPVLNEKFDAVDNVLCQMKATLNLICWLDASGGAEAVMGDILVAQHRLLSDVLSLETLLQDAESEA